MNITYRFARRVAVAVIGGSLVVLGILLLVLPGPGLVTAAAGLAVLGLEFAWARRWLGNVRKRISDVRRRQRIKNGT